MFYLSSCHVTSLSSAVVFSVQQDLTKRQKAEADIRLFLLEIRRCQKSLLNVSNDCQQHHFLKPKPTEKIIHFNTIHNTIHKGVSGSFFPLDSQRAILHLLGWPYTSTLQCLVRITDLSALTQISEGLGNLIQHKS